MTHPSRPALRRGRSAAAIAVVAAAAAAPALAQNTTSGINGVVTGSDGKPLAGATVTIVHVESGSTNTMLTDAAGRYSARGLRAGGPYTVTVSKDGQTERRAGVFLNLAEAFSYDATVGNSAQVVTVTGRSANDRINRGNMGASTAISGRDLEAFASIGRSLQDYARVDPRLSQTDKNRGEISAAGQNSRYNSITVDGVRINDTFGLESNGLPTIKQPISIDAIQAVQVNISNYDVTQQGYTGANINAVTKSGTNDLKGSLYYVYRNDDLAGDRFFNRPDRYQAPPVFKDTTTGFTLGGPIIKDRLFFFASYEELKSNRNTPVVGPLGSGLSEIGITAAEIASAQAAATGRGFDIGVFSTAGDLSVKDTLVKLDWNISDRHRASVRYAKTEEANPIFPGYSNFNNASSISLSSRNYVTSKELESVVAQVLSDWTDNFSTELKYSLRQYTSEPLNNSNLPEILLVYTNPAPANTPTGNRTLRVGTEETRHFNRIETETTNLYLAGNLNYGSHEIKLGADLESNEIFNAFVRRAKGQYTFQGADPAALLTAGNPTAYRVQVARPGFTLNDAAADVTFDNTGLFVQDTWTFNRQLRLSGGVRVDTIGSDRKPIYNAAAQAAFGLDNSNMIDGERLVQPRFGFNYRHEKEDKQVLQVRGGFGLFQGNAATVWLVNPFQNTGMVLSDFSCSTTTTPCPAGLFTANPNNPATVPGAATANVDFLAAGTEQPSVWKMNLALDTELGYGLTAGAEWLYTRVNNGLAYRHLNLGAPTTTSPTDGRDLYWNAGGRNPACWLAGDATPSTSGACATNASNPQQRPTSRFNNNRSFADVLVIENTDKGKGNALTVSLSQALREWGINWSAAYTWTSATEVSPLTSSTSFSQWANRAVFNPNEAAEAPSSSLIRNRINLSASWSKSWTLSTKTTFGVFYEARSGRNYSWTYNNDANGDGVQGNDLLYVPRGPGSGEVLFKLPGAANTTANSGAAAEARFWSIVDSDAVLSGSRGKVVGRNSSQSKITQNFDVRLGQEFRGFLPSHRAALTLDILNFANLLNKKWGRIEELGFSDGSGGRVRRWVNYSGTDAQGRAIYTVNDPFEPSTSNNSGESAWAAQLTFRYSF